MNQMRFASDKELLLEEQSDCYAVVNGDEFPYDDDDSILHLVSSGKSFYNSRAEFEAYVKKCYNTNNTKWVSVVRKHDLNDFLK